MPKLLQRPSFNHEVIKDYKLQDLLNEHPDADPDFVKKEWEKAGGAESKPEKAEKK